jgi:transposase InsO family protein
MKISRSGYYKWLKRKGIDNRYIEYRKYLLNEIKLVYSKHKTWGYHRIAAKIRNDTGLIFSDLLIHKICKANNIYSKARKKPYKKPCEEHVIYSNNIQGNWNTTSPFQKIATDTTIFWNKGKYYDLTMYIDVFNNEIIAYDLAVSKHGASPSNHLKAKMNLIKAKIKRGYINTETIVHSDQGVIYTSFAYNNAFKDYNISRSMSRRATPTDNPIIESINGWIKEELFKEWNLSQCDDIHITIRQFIHYYNNERLAFALNYKSPIQYRTELGFN